MAIQLIRSVSVSSGYWQVVKPLVFHCSSFSILLIGRYAGENEIKLIWIAQLDLLVVSSPLSLSRNESFRTKEYTELSEEIRLHALCIKQNNKHFLWSQSQVLYLKSPACSLHKEDQYISGRCFLCLNGDGWLGWMKSTMKLPLSLSGPGFHSEFLHRANYRGKKNKMCLPS